MMDKYLSNPKILKIIDQLGDYFKDLPHLPKNIKDFLVGIAPIAALIGGVLTIFSSLSMLLMVVGLNGLSPFAFMVGSLYWRGHLLFLGLLAVIYLLVGGLLIKAFPLLKKRRFAGWLYLYYAMIISLLSSLLSINGFGGLIWEAIWLGIHLYLLYEIRPAYKKAKK